MEDATEALELLFSESYVQEPRMPWTLELDSQNEENMLVA